MITLGIDCGTQSLKVIVWDIESNDVISVSRSYGLIKGLPPGHKEQDPSTWIGALESCMGQLAQEIYIAQLGIWLARAPCLSAKSSRD